MEENKEKDKNKYGFRYYEMRSMAMAGYCMMHKFILHKVTPDKFYPRRNVFHFTNSPALLKCIDEYKQLKNKI